MNPSELSKKIAARPAHKRSRVSPLHLELNKDTDNPRADVTHNSPAIYPLRLPPRARNYSKSELATVATMFMKLKSGDDLRMEKVTDIRTALEHEDYESAMKVEIAVERLLADLELSAAAM